MASKDKKDLYVVLNPRNYATQSTQNAAQKFAACLLADVEDDEIVIFKAVKRYKREVKIVVSDF
jgi:NH3-dependent NAD+ synthetase